MAEGSGATEPNIGKPIRRKEDQRFLTGKGNYVDDIKRPGMTYGYILRSQVAHAKITKLDTTAAEQMEGVLNIFTHKDITEAKLGGLPCGWLITGKGVPMVEPPHAILVETVRHVGDSILMVVAETREQAKAAAQAVVLDYDMLPVAATLTAASAAGAPQIWEQAPGNLCYDWEIGDRAATDAGFAKADKIVEIEITNNRLVPNAMEPRAAIGEYDSGTGDYTLWTTSQNPHVIRLMMAAYTVFIPEHKLRVIAPDVGGGFGSKIFHYGEEALITWAAAKVGRPIKWTSDRSEAFVTDAHGRDHISKGRVALSKDGTFLAMDFDTKANMGAYLSTFASSVPTYLYAPLLAGVYKTSAVHVNVKAYFTNTTCIDAYRGAGRPEATYLLERLVDKAAREMGMSVVDIRRKNMITTDMFPYQTPLAFQYDTGNFQATLDMALEKNDYKNFDKRREESKKNGKLRGIGFSTYVEACGIAPSAVAGSLGARAGLYEQATIRVNPTGSVSLFTGTHSHGQGHETTFAQIVSDYLGIPMESIDHPHGDTAKIAFGMGTYGSRSLPVGGSAIYKALQKVIAKGKKIAAHLMEADAADIEFKDGKFTVKGTDKVKMFGEIAFAAYVPHNYPLETLEPGLEEQAYYDPLNFTFPGGTHIVETEVDPETGVVKIVSVTAADDVGVIINPMIVEGQLQGGIAQGIGQALLEEAAYDEDGQLVTASFMNYTMPRAGDFPFFDVMNHTTACTHNPLGVKGVGECGAIGVPPAVINSVIDALSSVGVTDMSMPASPQKVWRAIQDAKKKKGGS